MMGSKSLPWFFISAFCYFIPYALIVAQYSRKYADRSGTIYDWLKDSLSPKAAFVTAFLWYCSYFTWMVSLFMKLMIPLSILLFGQDLTDQIHWLNLPAQVWLACFSIMAVLFVTRLITRGFKTIVAFLKISSGAMAGLFLLSLGNNLFIILKEPAQFLPNIQTSFTITSFFEGADTHFLAQAAFFIFSITAFGGLDTVASLVDQIKDSRRRFPKAIIFSAGIITALYFSGIILWSGASNLASLRQVDQIHLGNLMYSLMGHSARQLSQFLGLSAQASTLVYQFYIRYTAFTMLTAYISLLSSITYGPLKSLLKGTPTTIWPKHWIRLNQHQMPERALWLQAALISLMIFMVSINNHFLANLYNQLTYMTNVSRAIPYFIVAASFPFFLKKKMIAKEHLLIEHYGTNVFLSVSVCLCIFLAIGFQIYEPLRLGNYLNVSTLLLGPCAFGLFGFWLYKKAETQTIS
jgi:amino acid transporter